MKLTSSRIPYRQTNAFSSIAMDYIDRLESIRPFYNHPPTIQGIQEAINEREKKSTNRSALVEVLQQQYKDVATSQLVKENINSLLSDNTFTITTAHQNNIFTGPLYFIYKIIHVIKLADTLKTSLPAYHFVPVFYIGSEDADIEELNHFTINGDKKIWNTKQTGAVGRMIIDKSFLSLIDAMEGQLAVFPHGDEIISLIRQTYRKDCTLQDATFEFVNQLFLDFGLVILLPDNAMLKKQMQAIFEDDLLNQRASSIVEKTAKELALANYKVQANPREINLFYLYEDKRERIEYNGKEWKVNNDTTRFSKESLVTMLAEHPERFSPNVILRGLYQETILPNIAFVGGAGETAYWLQLKELFHHYQVPFPVLVLRNSFLVIEEKWKEAIRKLDFTFEDFFANEDELLNQLVKRETNNPLHLNDNLENMDQLYEQYKRQVATIDTTLVQHVDALKTKAIQRIKELEKKMLRAEKRKFTDQQRKIQSIRKHLFPGNGLQERVENISLYYAKWGKDFVVELYRHSLSLEQEFVVLTEE